MVSNKNSNEYIINKLEYYELRGINKEYITLIIKNNFESDNDLININNIFKSYSTEPEACNHNIYNVNMYYDIIHDKIIDVINLLDSFQGLKIKFLLHIKYVSNKYPIRIRINNQGKKIFTLNATKILCI